MKEQQKKKTNSNSIKNIHKIIYFHNVQNFTHESIAVKPDFHSPVVARRRYQPRHTRIPLRTIDILRVRVVHTADQAKSRRVLIGIALLAEDPDNVVAAGRHDQTGLLAPVDVVDGSGMIAGQGADALPDGLVVRRRYAHLVVGFVLLPDFQGLVVAARNQAIARAVERQTPDRGCV